MDESTTKNPRRKEWQALKLMSTIGSYVIAILRNKLIFTLLQGQIEEIKSFMNMVRITYANES